MDEDTGYTPHRVPPNERTPYLLDEVIEHGDENGALANATADELRDALARGAERIREVARAAGLYRYLRHDISCALSVRALPESERCNCGLAERWKEASGG